MAAARRAFQVGGSLRKVAFGEIDGRLDLRGLPAPDLLVVNVPILHQARWRNLDLSGATLDNLRFLTGGSIENCRFDRADLSDLALFRVSVSRSSFVRTSLRGAMMGSPATWRDCDLSHADLRDTTSDDTLFERCRFDHAVLRKRKFDTDRLVGCSFAGLVYDCQFGRAGGPADLVRDTSFADAELRYQQFWGLDLPGCTPPTGEGMLVIHHPRRVFSSLVDQTAEDPSHPLAWMRDILVTKLERIGPNQAFDVWRLADWSLTEDVEGGRAGAALIAALDGEDAAGM